MYRLIGKNGGKTSRKSGEAGFLRFVGLPLRTLLLVGCLLSLAGFLGVRSGTQNEARNDFLLSAETRVQAVQREIEENFGALQVLRAYFESSKDDGAAGFDRFASQTMPTYRSLRALEWAPRVRDPARRGFEARVRGIVTGVPNGKLNRAPQRTEYYPIEYMCPLNRESAAIGYDVLSNPAMAAVVKRAIATGEPSSTGKVPLWDEADGRYGVLTFVAVYEGPSQGQGADWRTEHCRGVVISVVETADVLASALHDFRERGIRTYVFDLSANGVQGLLYGRVGAGKVESPEDLLEEKLVYARKLPAGGRDWQVVSVGTDFGPAGTNWEPLAFLMSALAVTAGVALYLHTIAKHTADLASANQDLRSQVENRQRAQNELEYHAYHDPLTGLPNRRQFGQRFNEAIERAKSTNDTLALFYVDLDGFKIINDTLGHAVGDAVLKDVAERFTKAVGRNDVVARTGGDEFNILLTEAGTGNLADRVAQGLLDSLSRPVDVGGRILTLSASIGISLFPQHGEDFQELAHCSDAAMYFAKKRGKNRYHRYTKELAVTTRRGMELALSLRGAIERNELCLFFQPIIGLGVDATLRFEALLRWRHPQMGLLGPGHFFSIAEETGLTALIGKWVLSEACRVASGWQSMGHRPIGVSVNISGLHFGRPEFMESIETALADSRLAPSLLEVEMSESAVVGEIEESLVRLGTLRRKGVSVAIDDFGTGFSSLTYLETLPIDALKIDRSFLPRSESNFRRLSLLRSLIALGRSLNLRVVVGGIEVARQFELVRGMGPNEVQGFLFSKPLSAAGVPEYIEKWNQQRGSADTDRILESTHMPADLVLVSSQRQAG